MPEVTAERLAKRIARAGVCSRRAAEELIIAGKVKVDGKVVTTPAFNVSEENVVEVSGKKLAAPMAARLWLYHKPAGLLTSHKDPEGRPTVFDQLPKSLGRVISVGRLDLNSEGLLLLTNDGELARKFELPSTGLKRIYRVRVRGHFPPGMVQQLRRGITVENVRYDSILLEQEPGTSGGGNRWVKVTLSEGKNREIRKVLGHFGLQVSRLIRVGYGPYELGDLKPGAVKEAELEK